MDNPKNLAGVLSLLNKNNESEELDNTIKEEDKINAEKKEVLAKSETEKQVLKAQNEALSQNVNKTFESQEKAIAENGLQKIELTELQSPEEQAKFATETLQMTPTERTKLQTKLSNSEYKQAGLSESQILSFLYTEKQLDAKGIQNSEFAVNFNKIRDDLNLYKPLKSIPFEPPSPVEVKNLNNLDNDSITALAQNNENLKAYS